MNDLVLVAYNDNATFGFTHGHTGWAFQLADGSFLAGATENPLGGDGVGKTGNDKGAWMTKFPTEAKVISAFASSKKMVIGGKAYVIPPYESYKRVPISKLGFRPNPNNATSKAKACFSRPYVPTGIPRGQNSLDDTYDVLVAYGFDNLTWPTTHPLPSDWYMSDILGKYKAITF